MERSGYRIASDVKSQKHEIGAFPTLCESCLGDNPYVRMIREHSNKECKICARPYTSFRWKPGPHARYKQTIICQSCSRLKNVCQTCLFDLEYGLPVQVRDKYLEEHQKFELPESYVNLNYMASQIDKLSEDLPYGKSSVAHEGLKKLARLDPYYKRNRPRVCSFWLKGACNRGASCPYMHAEEVHDPDLADQKIRDRFIGQDDPVASKILRRAQESSIKAQASDTTSTSINIGDLTPNIDEKAIRQHFSPHGDIRSIKMIPRQSCALVTYATRKSAEDAMSEFSENLVIHNQKLTITWGSSSQRITVPVNATQSQSPYTSVTANSSTHSQVYDSQEDNSKKTSSSYYASLQDQYNQENNFKRPKISGIPVYASMNPHEAEHRK